MDYLKKPAGAYYTSENNKQWYEQRNAEICKDKKARVSNATLVAKYGISIVAIQKIYNRERRRHGFRNTQETRQN
jgi:hypothetical protein